MHNDELMHYGVPGMRWGVRRATKKLSNSKSTREDKVKAVGSLQKHKTKAQNKVNKLAKQRTKLERNYEKFESRGEARAANLEARAARKRLRAYSPFTSSSKAAQLNYQATRMEAKAKSIAKQGAMYRKQIHANKKMTEAFNKGISEIDQVLAKQGRKYING